MTSAAADYARALFRAAAQSGSIEQVMNELRAMTEIIEGQKGYFLSPRPKASEHVSIIQELFTGRADRLTVQFLCLLASRRRLRLLPEACARFEAMARRELGNVRVVLRLPQPAGEPLIARLRDRLAESGLFPREKRDEAEFEIVLDKSLLGGFIAECDGRVIDASVKTRLVRLAGAR